MTPSDNTARQKLSSKYYRAVSEPGKPSYSQGLPKRNLRINNILSHPLADGDSFFGQRFWVGDIMLHYGLEEFIFVFPIEWRLLKINHKWVTHWVFLFMFLNSPLLMKWHGNTMPKEIHIQQCSLSRTTPKLTAICSLDVCWPRSSVFDSLRSKSRRNVHFCPQNGSQVNEVCAGLSLWSALISF